MQITENNQEIENIHYISTANMEIRNNQPVVYIMLGDLPIATYHSNSNELNYLHVDNLGSVIGITDEAGDILTRYNYDAWGRLRNPQDLTFLENSPPNNQIFRGYTFHEHIEYFNIINMNGRMYDPVTARFFSPDPLLQDPTNTQNLNRYTYVLNNPLTYTDPSGYAYQGFGNSQINGVSTILINSSSQISQQVQDMETRRKGFVNNLWQDVTLFDLIGFYGGSANSLFEDPPPIAKYGRIIKVESTKENDLIHFELNEFTYIFNTKRYSAYSIEKAVNFLNSHSHESWKDANGECGLYIRYSLEIGFGMKKDALKGKTTDRTGYAKNMGPYIERLGFHKVNSEKIEKGDIAIIQSYETGKPAGHAQMFNGTQWISDFKQNGPNYGFWPGRGYRENQPNFQIYRWKPKP